MCTHFPDASLRLTKCVADSLQMSCSPMEQSVAHVVCPDLVPMTIAIEGMKVMHTAKYTHLVKVRHQLLKQCHNFIAASCVECVWHCLAHHSESVLLKVPAAGAHASQCFTSLMALHSSANLFHVS